MLKYSFRCYFPDNLESPVISCIVPAEDLFTFLNQYSSDFVIKAYILDESEDK